MNSFIIVGEITNQQYGTIVHITSVEKPIKYSMNLRSNGYKPGFTNLLIKNDPYGIEIIRPANITVPHLILNHLSGEYTVNSEISNSKEEIHVEIISSIKNEINIEANRNEISQFLINVNASLKCVEISSNVSEGATSMVIPDITSRWL